MWSEIHLWFIFFASVQIQIYFDKTMKKLFKCTKVGKNLKKILVINNIEVSCWPCVSSCNRNKIIHFNLCEYTVFGYRTSFDLSCVVYWNIFYVFISSNLAALFSKARIESGNPTLTYTPPKQPKTTGSPKSRALTTSSNTLDLLFIRTVQSFKL